MQPVQHGNSDAYARYTTLKENSQSQYRWNIAKTAFAILGGLTVTGLCATLSIKLITGKSITTQFVGLGSLILTVPIGVAVPVTIGIKVAKGKDWTRYHDEEVAHQKCDILRICTLEQLSKINLKTYGKCGILSDQEARDIKEVFVDVYQQNKKVLDKAKKKHADYLEALENKKEIKEGEVSAIEHQPINAAWKSNQELIAAWSNFQDSEPKSELNPRFSKSLPHILPFGK